ncbi:MULTISPECIES: GntR family transcriptional regulator [unclassified Streptomyces]|uniref:GntR family transcriptional regulator n=1 Tax=Streptomyces sp. NBC_00060 TaxID=2975636 RepID=A0AAU2GVC6_9ACTN
MTETRPAAERAYTHVRTLLLDGTHPGGTLLSEGVVAEELGISRTPVREAFLQLQAEGFLRLYPKRGALVVPVTLTEGRETMEARLLLELYAIDATVARGADAVRELGASLSSALSKDTARPGPTQSVALGVGQGFHTQLVAGAGNSVVTEMYGRLWIQQLRIAAASITTVQHADEDIDEHAAIAEALSHGDTARARRLLQQHTSAILRRLGLGDHDLRLPGRG